MQLIVSDDSRNVILDGLSGRVPKIKGNQTHASGRCNLWEIASTQARPAGSSNEIVRGVLVDVCGLFALCFDDFKYSVDLETVMRVLQDTFSIDYDFGKMCWIDTTTEELGRIVVEILGRVGYE